MVGTDTARESLPRFGKSNAERQRKYRQSLTAEEKRERQRQKRMDANAEREFIWWDGEGIDVDGRGKPQAYVLFGSSSMDRIVARDGTSLHFTDCFELILRVARANPGAWHVGFAFDYDVNQILRHMPYRYLQILNDTGSVKYGPYRIEWRRGKSFRVSKTHNGTVESVVIYDIFSFFATSFVKALETVFKDDDRYSEQVAIVVAGKQNRKVFELSELESHVIPYWEAEAILGAALATRFRDLLYSADFPITQWYGPGAVASLVLNRERIRDHMSVPPPEVIEAAQYAYAGGRFEMFRVGRVNQPVWALDINSAYPDALRRLPSLAGGHWRFESIGQCMAEIPRENIESFALYHVTLSHPQYRQPFYPNTPPGPLFCRLPDGEIRYPWNVEGWYWGPEVENLCHPRIREHVYVFGAYIFEASSEVHPFGFLEDMYAQRAEWKRSGKPEQLALKLGMNSIYGKLAQRIGWEQKGAAPTFHQLEWAGWVTSYVRATLFRTLWLLGLDIVAVETDGIYVTRNPESIGISSSTNLGGWDIKRYDEIMYLQSGTYFARSGEKWISKYRGLDPNSLEISTAMEYLHAIVPGTNFPPLHGTTTRYNGLSTSMSRANGDVQKFRSLFGTWEQEHDRDIAPGTGKRQHYPDSCVECAKGISPYDAAHYMSIGIDLHDPVSTKHILPWKDREEEEPTWRQMKTVEQGKLFEL